MLYTGQTIASCAWSYTDNLRSQAFVNGCTFTLCDSYICSTQTCLQFFQSWLQKDQADEQSAMVGEDNSWHWLNHQAVMSLKCAHVTFCCCSKWAKLVIYCVYIRLCVRNSWYKLMSKLSVSSSVRHCVQRWIQKLVFSVLGQECRFCMFPRTPQKLRVLTQFAKLSVDSVWNSSEKWGVLAPVWWV